MGFGVEWQTSSHPLVTRPTLMARAQRSPNVMVTHRSGLKGHRKVSVTSFRSPISPATTVFIVTLAMAMGVTASSNREFKKLVPSPEQAAPIQDNPESLLGRTAVANLGPRRALGKKDYMSRKNPSAVRSVQIVLMPHHPVPYLGGPTPIQNGIDSKLEKTVKGHGEGATFHPRDGLTHHQERTLTSAHPSGQLDHLPTAESGRVLGSASDIGGDTGGEAETGGIGGREGRRSWGAESATDTTSLPAGVPATRRSDKRPLSEQFRESDNNFDPKNAIASYADGVKSHSERDSENEKNTDSTRSASVRENDTHLFKIMNDKEIRRNAKIQHSLESDSDMNLEVNSIAARKNEHSGESERASHLASTNEGTMSVTFAINDRTKQSTIRPKTKSKRITPFDKYAQRGVRHSRTLFWYSPATYIRTVIYSTSPPPSEQSGGLDDPKEFTDDRNESQTHGSDYRYEIVQETSSTPLISLTDGAKRGKTGNEGLSNFTQRHDERFSREDDSDAGRVSVGKPIEKGRRKARSQSANSQGTSSGSQTAAIPPALLLSSTSPLSSSSSPLKPASFSVLNASSGSSSASSSSGFYASPSSSAASFSSPSTFTMRSAKRRMARQEGDLILGALFPVHEHPPIQTAYSRVCGAIREFYGIQRIETFMMTVAEINKNDSILPNITLGWDIRDSCWYSAIALEQSIDFIQDAIASKVVRADGTLVNAVDPQASPSSPSSSKTAQSEPCRTSRNKPIVGLIGPGSSEATIQVQNLMQIFNIPQIGYSATSMDLSDKNIYKYFLRVVPPDKYQVQALVDLVRAFNWTYISTVHSDGNYGLRGQETFKHLANSYNICIATADSVASSDIDNEFDRVVDTLRKFPNASVVVCFCEGNTVRKLLESIKRKGQDGKFLIIGSDGWGNRLDVVQGQEKTAAGGISIKLFSPPLPWFLDKYASLQPDKNLRNPWFKEFWQEKFKCYLAGPERDTRFIDPCTGQETLAVEDALKDADQQQDSKLGFVVNAVNTMALALHGMHADLCPGHSGLCPKMTPVNGTLFLEYLLNVSFSSYSGQVVRFDHNGDPPGRYEILNYQPLFDAESNITVYKYVTVGLWHSGALELNVSAIYWPGRGRNPPKPFQSVCSQPCRSGYVKQGVGSDGTTCCWVCTPCKDNEIVIGEDHCEACPQGFWPNSNQTDCHEMDEEFVTLADTGSIVVAALASVGLLFTAWVTLIFIRSHNTPVVKASTRELSYILLIGIALAFSCNFILMSKPNPAFCYLSRIIPGLSFSLMYGALVTRTNRIARILEGSKRIMTKKPRFMSATAQLVITGIIIGIECVVISVMLVLEPPDSKFDYSVPKRVRLVCNTSTLGTIVPLGFDLFLIFMCTLYAVKTRNLPENFNEAKFIGFTMYTTCVIWLGFVPIYFAGQNKEVTMSISISLSAAIALMLLFLPKVYIIIWAPEKNTRGAFTTSKDVRCHIGSKSMPSSDSVEFREGGRYDAVHGKGESGTKFQQKAWRQKSLDEKKLRFVMKRSSILSSHPAPPSTTINTTTTTSMTRGTSPAASSSTAYVNHGVLTNYKAGPLAQLRAGESRSFDLALTRKKSSLKQQQQQDHHRRLYVDDFSDFDCLLEEEKMDEAGSKGSGVGSGAGDGGARAIPSGAVYRDTESQTGEELIQGLFLHLRRRHFHASGSRNPSPTSHPQRPIAITTYQDLPSPPAPPSSSSSPSSAAPLHACARVKEVTFDTHVIPVHVDSSWTRGEGVSVPEELSFLSRNYCEDGYLKTGFSGESQRRMSDLSSISYMDGVSSPETPKRAHPSSFRRSSDTSDVSSIYNLSTGKGRGGSLHKVYHRPPTPRTPRKLLIQNNADHADLAAVAAAAAASSSSSAPAPTTGSDITICIHQQLQDLQQQPLQSRDSHLSPYPLRVECAGLPLTRSVPTKSVSPVGASSLASPGGGSCRPAAGVEKEENKGDGEEKEEKEEEEGEEAGVETVCLVGEKEKGRGQDKGVMELQQYLQNRGLSLDMSSMQTSDV